jgi:hypothetical protein
MFLAGLPFARLAQERIEFWELAATMPAMTAPAAP